MTGWRSVHLFHSHAGQADLLALAADEILRRAAPDPADWFFIRYGEGGPHVRVRIGASNGAAADAILAQLRDRCAEIAAVPVGLPVSGYPDEEGRLFGPGEAVEIAYRPELLRYGGPVAILEHERLFRSSTALSIGAVRRLPDIGQRGRLAVDLMLGAAAVLAAAGYGSALDFVLYYRSSWRTMLPERTESEDRRPRQPLAQVPERLAALRVFLDGGSTPTTLAQHWTHALESLLTALLTLHRRGDLLSPLHGHPPGSARELGEAMFHMIFSQAHMICNRLGLSPSQELAIVETLAASLSAAARAPD
ncbi:MAG: hypothetical protein JOZ90_11460 [Alphaproteobacteria bacterium]|nr:hypothetical protein [Alphaproteobacteria bacterium]MBV9372023.1 hypothetical protein [Alphaproteobacteria bacterium]MBV9901703.1 hypothetical protein [Alphaproteobacteria bacterium]